MTRTPLPNHSVDTKQPKIKLSECYHHPMQARQMLLMLLLLSSVSAEELKTKILVQPSQGQGMQLFGFSVHVWHQYESAPRRNVADGPAGAAGCLDFPTATR